MSRLAEIKAQIEALHKQAEQIRAEEFEGALQKILDLMEGSGITTKDIESKIGSTRKGVKAEKKPATVKFRGPNGDTWSGRGLTPHWMRDLVAQGKSKEDYLVAEVPTAAPPASV